MLSIHLKGNIDCRVTQWTHVIDWWPLSLQALVSWKCIQFSLYLQRSITAAFIATTCPPHLTESLSFPDLFSSWTCVIVFRRYTTGKFSAVCCLDFYLNPPVFIPKRSSHNMPHRSESTTLLPNGAIETTFQLVNRMCWFFDIFSNFSISKYHQCTSSCWKEANDVKNWLTDHTGWCSNNWHFTNSPSPTSCWTTLFTSWGPESTDTHWYYQQGLWCASSNNSGS